MLPRSEKDKEYFAQDWFEVCLEEAGLLYRQQGRNSYPDYWVGEEPTITGYEVKCLAFSRGRPARRDIDFNSTIPSGRKAGKEVFLVFFLYTGTGASSRQVHTISVAHGDLVNSDHALADEHLNVAIRDFGSYADGFIRNRKMYVFPHPLTIDPEGLGQHRLIVPSQWGIEHSDLIRIKTIDRVVAARAVDSYTIRLHGRGEADVVCISSTNAGARYEFDVFALR